MASDLATRMPLLETQHRHLETEHDLQFTKTAKTTTITGTYSPHCSNYLTQSLLPEHKENIVNHQDQTETGGGLARSSGSLDESTMSETMNGPTLSTYMNAGGFRYQIRRPVESWKFVETRKQDGSILYLCRLCGSSYKHKKSLNKHWKDKHIDVPRPQGAQPDEDDDGEEEGDEDGDESDIENVPPEIEASRTTQVFSSNNCASLTTSILDSSGMGTKLCESSERMLLSERAALRRLSAPISRPMDRGFHPRRSSYVSSDRSSTENRSTKPAPQKPSLPLKRRFRTSESPPKQASISSVYTIPEHTGYCVQEPTVKRRASIFDLTEARHHNEGSFQSRVLEPISGGNITTHSHSSRPGNIPENFSEVHSGSVAESQPLDLSMLRPTEFQHTSSTSSLETKPIKKPSNKASSEIDVSLLIGLLQTALNTLTSEVREASKRSGGPVSSTSLSKTSSSLLLAIGTLLVTMVDKAKEECVTETSPSPISERNCLSVGTTSSFPQNPVSTPCWTPSSHVLPPAPPSVLVSPAMDAIKPRLSENLLGSRVGTLGLYSGGSDHSFVQFQSETDNTVRTPPTKQSHHASDVLHFSTPNSSHHSRSADPFPTGTSRDTDPTQSDLTPLRHSRTQTKPATYTASGPTTDTTTKAPRSNDDDGKSVCITAPGTETQSECQIICPVCQFDARWFSELRAHMVNHSEHRMFGCCYCPYRAKWKWDVAKHMRRCPLGRHVAHLSNESLLRIVRYHPPPKGNILFNYFPQDGFPGVGLDRPPTPPTVAINDEAIYSKEQVGSTQPIQARSQSPLTSQYRSDSVNRSWGTRMHSPVCEPPILTRHEAVTPEPVEDSALEMSHYDTESDQSPKPLVIVDDSDTVGQQLTGSTRVGHTTRRKSEIEVSQSAIRFRPHSTDQPECPEIKTSGLVFKLRKCFHCTFHCIEENEYQLHLQTHRSATSPSINNDPHSHLLTTLSSNGCPVLTS